MEVSKEMAEVFKDSIEMTINAGTIFEKTNEWNELKAREKKLTKELADIKDSRIEVEEELYKILDNENLKSVRNRFGLFYKKETLHASVSELNKNKCHTWLEEIGAEGLIVTGVNANTFKAFIKERKEGNKEIPVFISTFLKKGVGHRK